MVEAWQKKQGKNQNGGLNQQGRNSYNHNHHAHLKPPCKNHSNARHKSFCARMHGMKKHLTSSKTAPTRAPQLAHQQVSTGVELLICVFDVLDDGIASSKTASDPNSRINKSLRAWNC